MVASEWTSKIPVSNKAEDLLLGWVDLNSPRVARYWKLQVLANHGHPSRMINLLALEFFGFKHHSPEGVAKKSSIEDQAVAAAVKESTWTVTYCSYIFEYGV